MALHHHCNGLLSDSWVVSEIKDSGTSKYGALCDVGEIQRETKSISEYLRGDRLTDEERETSIGEFEAEDDDHVGEERRKQSSLSLFP